MCITEEQYGGALTWNAGVSLGPSLPLGSDQWYNPASPFHLSGPQLAYS